MRIRTIIGALSTAAALTVSGMPAFAETAQPISVEWSDLTLTTDTASWNLTAVPVGQEFVVQRYELSLDRMYNGYWKEDYRRIKCQGDDTSYDITFSTVGQYRFAVRAYFYGGLYSTWSDEDGFTPGINISNTIVVTSDDVTKVDTSGDHSKAGGPGVVTDSSVSVTAQNGQSGWVQSGDKWYYKYANNTLAKNGWQNINNKWYYFNADGVMQVGWVNYQGNWYLCLPSGEMATGWRNVNEKWYYMNDSGVMLTGYITLNGQTFYCDATGARVQNAYSPDGHYFDQNGVMVR